VLFQTLQRGYISTICQDFDFEKTNMFELKCLQIQGCQKVTATSDIAGYFAVITGYKLAGKSDKSGNTIKEKKAGQK